MRIKIATLFLLLLAHSAIAQERILDFQSTVVVNKDRSVDVTEIIVVNVEGTKIKHGIFRDIITTTENSKGWKNVLNLKIDQVSRDGYPEAYDLEKINNVHQIKIGNLVILLEPKIYTYTIRYNLEKQVRFFDKYDELYWNVTGNGWQFKIDSAHIKVILPEGAVISQHAGYSGSSGETGCNCTYDSLAPNSISYVTSSGLDIYQGLTVAVGWQKGIVPAPSADEIEQELLEENRSVYYGEFGVGILAVYLFVAWFFVGRDPAKTAIIPRFDPPDGFSPAACRYVTRLGFDNKAFTSSIVNMAVKGYLVIDHTPGNYTLRKVSDDTEKLSHGERRVAVNLFSNTDTVDLGSSYSSSVADALAALKSHLRNEFRSQTFRKNYGWMVPAILIGLATWGLALIYLYNNTLIFGSMIAITIIMLINVPLTAQLRKAKGLAKITAALPLVIFLAFPIAIFILIGFAMEANLLTLLAPYIIILFCILTLIILFFYLIQAPTVFGQKRMDEIEGLVLFMNAAEKDRLNMLNPPEKTIQLFERLLPYAIALDVENAWGRQFDSILQQAIQNNQYRPGWYGGDFDHISHVGRTSFTFMSSDFGSSMSSAVSTSSTAPASSGDSDGGSDGGGSSGGGGGGGGGGGW